MAPINQILVSLLFFITLLQPALGEEASFWMMTDKSESGWSVMVPNEKDLRSQATLLHTTLDVPYEHSKSRLVLAQLYSDIEQFQMMGKKRVQWGKKGATLVSFRGKSGEKNLAARALIGPSQRGTEILILIYHPKSPHNYAETFDELKSLTPSTLPDSIKATTAGQK